MIMPLIHCHHLADRTLQYGGFECWYCVRCSAIYASFLFGAAPLWLFRSRWRLTVPLALTAFLGILSVSLDLISGMTSNTTRYISGGCLGWGLAILTAGFFASSGRQNGNVRFPVLLLLLFFLISEILRRFFPSAFIAALSGGAVAGSALLAGAAASIAAFELYYLFHLISCKGKNK